VSVTDGVLNIDFTAVADNAKVSAIEVFPHGASGDPFLHVVIDAPRSVVDYDGNGQEVVRLRGSGSHTHELGKTIVGWTWTLDGSVVSTAPDTDVVVALGPHTVSLTIADNNAPAHTLAGSVTFDVYPINAVGGALARYYPAGGTPLTTLIDALPAAPGFIDVVPTLRIEGAGTQIGRSPYTSNVVVVFAATFVATTTGTHQFGVTGGSANRIFIDGVPVSGAVNLAAGPHPLEVRIAIPSAAQLPAEVRVSVNGGSAQLLDKTTTVHDQTNLKPFINAMPLQGVSAGGELITIEGLGFFPANAVVVNWGNQPLTSPVISVTPTAITLMTPGGTGTVSVTVQTPNGVSNPVSFAYQSGGGVPIAFSSQALANPAAPTQAAWGPDGRLYVASLTGEIHAYTFDGNYAITATQVIGAIAGVSNPHILGIAFNPFDPPSPIRIYVAHSLLFANGGACFTGASPYSGQVSVLVGPTFGTVQPLITGLPVSNHDHGINGMAFDEQGDLLIAVGGNTNAGIRHCNMGDLPESPLSAAILKARISDPAFNGQVTYRLTSSGAPSTDQVAGDIVDVAPGVNVETHVSGLRNPFDIVWTMRGQLYGTDNGPNLGFGAASTSATTQAPDPEAPDEILWLAEGHYYGHPNRNRGRSDPRQNAYHGPTTLPVLGMYTAPLATVLPSSNGIDEYRATAFNGGMRGHLLVQHLNGQLHRVVLSGDGREVTAITTVANAPPALDVLTGPGGVILSIDYTGNVVSVLRPSDAAAVGVTAYDIFPWRARAGAPFVIGGVHFGTAASTTVTIGGVPATVTSVSPTRIHGVIPASSTPTAQLLDVTVQSGGQTSTIAGAFRYVLQRGAGLGRWQTAAPIPAPLGEVAGGVINGVLYVVGQGSNATMAFDWVTEAWYSLAPRPFPGDHHAAEVIKGRLYLFGGLNGEAPGKVQIYDPLTDSWSLGADIPFATGSASTALIGGKVYLAGGIVGTATTSEAAVYDPVLNMWTPIAPMPAGRNHAAAGTDRKRFYVFGGRGPGSGSANEVAIGFDDTQVYDPTTNTWQTSAVPASLLPPLPQKRGGMGKAAYLGGEFYVIGGETTSGGTGQVSGNVYNRVDVYDPLTKSWRLDTPLPTARHGIFPLTYDGRIYVIGGGTAAGFSSSNAVEVFSR
jgi:N-acetylneuraminic acid mutarotase/glucose/arabinose dehydrogenase